MIYEPLPFRFCTDCGAAYLPSPVFFYRSKRYNDGLYPWCKPCETARRSNPKHKRERLPEGYRRCRQCKEVFPFEQLVHSVGQKDGVVHLCVSCGNAESRERYQSDLEHARVTSRNRHSKPEARARKSDREHERYFEDVEVSRANAMAAYYANKPSRSASSKKWKLANRDRVRTNERAWRDRTREHQRALGRQRYASNPIKYRVKSLKRRSAQGTHTPADVLNCFNQQDGQCYWCSTVVGDVYHVDHVMPLSRGGTNDPHNLVISCPNCNLSKFNKLPYIEWQPPNPLKLHL